MEEEGAEHISTQDVEDAQLRATLAATRVDELRAQVVDRSRRHRAKRPRDVVGGAKKRKGKRNRKEKKKPVVAAAGGSRRIATRGFVRPLQWMSRGRWFAAISAMWFCSSLAAHESRRVVRGE